MSSLFLELRQPSIVQSLINLHAFSSNSSSNSENGPLHLMQSFRLNQRVRICANLLEDNFFHTMLQKRDMITQVEMY